MPVTSFQSFDHRRKYREDNRRCRRSPEQCSVLLICYDVFFLTPQRAAAVFVRTGMNPVLLVTAGQKGFTTAFLPAGKVARKDQKIFPNLKTNPQVFNVCWACVPRAKGQCSKWSMQDRKAYRDSRVTSKNSLAPAYDTDNSVHESVHMKWIKSHQALINLHLEHNEYDSAGVSSHQISDRVTRQESAELSIARMKVSSLEYCWMMLSSMFTRSLGKTVNTFNGNNWSGQLVSLLQIDFYIHDPSAVLHTASLQLHLISKSSPEVWFMLKYAF